MKMNMKSKRKKQRKKQINNDRLDFLVSTVRRVKEEDTITSDIWTDINMVHSEHCYAYPFQEEKEIVHDRIFFRD